MSAIDRRHFLRQLSTASLSLAAACHAEPSGSAIPSADDGSVDASFARPRADAGGDGVENARDAAGDAASARSASNIVLIAVDQFAESFAPGGAHAPASFSLPAYQRLLAAGVRFSRHYCNAVPCTPSRAVMYTGQHAPVTGMLGNAGLAGQADLSPTLPTLGSMLQSRGFATAYFGKWHLSEFAGGNTCAEDTTRGLEAYGFDEFNPCGDVVGKPLEGARRDPDTADSAVAWLESRALEDEAAAPFFLAVNFLNPHDIMFFYPNPSRADSAGVPAPHTPTYEKQWEVSLPASFAATLDDRPPAQQAYKAAYDRLQSYPDTEQGRADLEVYINYYLNCLVDVDTQIGRVLDALERGPFAERTIVVFTSDHGEMGAVLGLRGKGPMIYEENSHVPFVVVHPEHAPREVSALSCHLDLAPTLLALSGLTDEARRERFPALHGVDLSALLTEQEGATRAAVLFTFDFGRGVDGPDATTTTGATRGLLRGLYDGKHKMARYFAASDHHAPRDFEELISRNDVELYDMTQAEPEVANLAATPAEVRASLESLNAALNELAARELGDPTA